MRLFMKPHINFVMSFVFHHCFMRVLLAVLLFFSALFFVSCSSERRSESGGKLLIYATFEHEQVAQYLEAFKKANPTIDYEVIIDSHGVIMAKLLAEKSNPKADVIFGLSAYNLEQLKNENLLAPLDSKNINIPHLNAFLDGFRDAANPPYYLGLSGVESVLIVNEKELAKKNLPIPSSYADLTNPIYKGLITMPNPSSSGTGFLSIVGFMQLFGEKGAWEYMDKLNANIALYTHSGSKPARLAVSGEYPIGISLGYRGHKMLLDKQPITMIFPKEGYGWDLESLALVKKDSIKDSAKTFIAWAASDSAMQLYASNNALTAIKTDSEIPLGYPQDSYERIRKIDFNKFSTIRDSILQEWDKQFANKNESK